MSEPDDIAEVISDLIDAYVDGVLDEAGYQILEARLRSDPALLARFVRYCRLHTDLCLEARVQRAGERVLDALNQITVDSTSGGWIFSGYLRRFSSYLVAAAVLLVALTGVWLISRPHEEATSGAIVWLTNAQDCKWVDGVEPGDLQPGKRIRIERGVAEFHFRRGGRLIVEGPADLEMLSDNSARLHKGKLTVRVTGSATGFTLLSPKGKVIDLGTEFGIEVADDGTTDVLVFEGKVKAFASIGKEKTLLLDKDQAARMDDAGIVLGSHVNPADTRSFLRAIVPPPVLVRRTNGIDFRHSVNNSICDGTGRGTGFTHRLPGTGMSLQENDANLALDFERGWLELTTTSSDINTQYRLGQGEYLGVRLADLGFTGKEDFEVTATIPNIPSLKAVGQFGLYAGVHSDKNIRGGVISRGEGEYTQFLVHNHGGRDSDLNMVGLLSPGTDLRLTLKRSAGKYALTIENQSTGDTSSVTIRPSEFLVGSNDLYVGLFGASPRSKVSTSLVVTGFKATVWTTTP
jgi:hypothetical protein